MTAHERSGRRNEPRQRASEATSGSVPAKSARKPRAARAASQSAPGEAPHRRSASTPRAPRRAKTVELPPVAPCQEIEALSALPPDEARRHVNTYLHDVMSGEDAGAFEAMNYRWELHLVDIEQVRMVRGVQLDPKKVRRYTAALRRGGGFPPLVGLGGEGKWVTENILLCDGYHRVAAMRRAGIYYAWAWLAVGMWQPAHVGSRVELGAGAS